MARLNQQWFKSSFSGGNDSNCVEVRFINDFAHVRNSTMADSPVLVFNRGEWDAFELGVFNGEFSMPA
ncbi:DUF397 domain-containing protein [Catenulispora rubra]|uniref:DUF397 domain-containing protein n=1 Tax=Catenulispora rubra TaxID=280293 RepID=UPI00189217FF|nr:DUF397 domain-containing protein [Catenulispora rubra]